MDNENLDTQKIPDVNCETAEQDHTAASSDEAKTSVQKDNWLDEILGTTATMRELGPDELAVHAAGLAHPEDMELEKILAEDWDQSMIDVTKVSGAVVQMPSYYINVGKQTAEPKNGGYSIESLNEQQLVYFISECLADIADALESY